jgi:hypothetical protein
MSAPALRALLEGIVDYAGLFPPAGLEMPAAVAEYASRRRGPDAWMLGRFVVNAARLPEMARAAAAHLREAGTEPCWRISALLADDTSSSLQEVARFDAALAPRAVVDTVEGRAGRADDAVRLLDAVPRSLTAYVEVPLDPDPQPILAALASRGARAKVRTGGLSGEAVPLPEHLARFLAECATLRLPWKATAGLHHPVRSEQPFTYAADSPRGTLHGFLNVFVAAILLRVGRIDLRGAMALLLERDPAAFAFTGDELRVGGQVLGARELAAARRDFACSFGSCSFADPVSDLRALGLLATPAAA